MKISGNLIVGPGDTTDYSLITEVSGAVYVHPKATLAAPALTEVGGSVYVLEGATFTAPALTEVGGYVDVLEGASCTAPALTEVGGYLFCEGVFDYSKIKFGAGEIIAISGYALHHKDGLLTAGCRVGWSYKEALAHWGDHHENQARARIFTAAIKELMSRLTPTKPLSNENIEQALDILAPGTITYAQLSKLVVGLTLAGDQCGHGPDIGDFARKCAVGELVSNLAYHASLPDDESPDEA